MTKKSGCGSAVLAMALFVVMVLICCLAMGCCARVDLVEEQEQIEMEPVSGYALARL